VELKKIVRSNFKAMAWTTPAASKRRQLGHPWRARPMWNLQGHLLELKLERLLLLATQKMFLHLTVLLLLGKEEDKRPRKNYSYGK
jgi:hypothetical protein